VAGAIFSGLAMVMTIVIPIRKIFGLEAYFTERHFDAMCKMVLLTGMIVFYAYMTEYFIAWYSVEVPERAAFWNRAFGDYWWATWIMLSCNGIIPMLFWFRRIRTNIPAIFVITIFINIGMWFERFVIIVTSLAREYEPWQWRNYQPTWVEMAITAGSFAWFFMWFLLFLRILPAVSVAELKEVLPAPLRFGRKRADAEA
jgi:molybdopterin-containing oxidoreductase family membrane subunit